MPMISEEEKALFGYHYYLKAFGITKRRDSGKKQLTSFPFKQVVLASRYL